MDRIIYFSVFVLNSTQIQKTSCHPFYGLAQQNIGKQLNWATLLTVWNISQVMCEKNCGNAAKSVQSSGLHTTARENILSIMRR